MNSARAWQSEKPGFSKADSGTPSAAAACRGTASPVSKPCQKYRVQVSHCHWRGRVSIGTTIASTNGINPGYRLAHATR
jgi:hypothetical protein